MAREMVSLYQSTDTSAIPKERVCMAYRDSHTFKRKVFWILAIVVSLTFLFSLVIEEPRAQLLTLTVTASSISFGFLFIVSHWERRLIAVKLLLLSYSLQPLFLVALLAVGYPTFIRFLGKSSLDLSQYPYRILLGLITIPLGVFIIIAIRTYFTRKAPGVSEPNLWLRSSDEKMPLFLVLGAIFNLFFFPVDQVESLAMVGYFMRIFHSASFAVPFLAGLYAMRFKKTTIVWLISLTTSLILGILMGTRYKAFYPIALFAIGWVVSLAPAHRKYGAILVLLGALPTFYISGIMLEARGDLGRDTLAIGLSDYLETARSIKEASDGSEPTRNLYLMGFRRVFLWANAVVPVATPEMVPSRGFSDIMHELISYISLPGLTGYGSDRLGLGFGNVNARRYGFNVTESTSVEFGILPDGWSRGGFMGALAYGALAAAFLIFIESFYRRLLNENSSHFVMVLFVLIGMAYLKYNTYGLVHCIRSTILESAFIAICLWPFTLLHGKYNVTVPKVETGP